MEANGLFLLAIILIASQGLEANYKYGRRRRWLPQLQCNSTSDCFEGQCCRGINGDIVGSRDRGLPESTLFGPGMCSWRQSRPGEPCSGCDCVEGYECYRTTTGACCPPFTCWLREEAEADREFWNNCFKDPKCHLPPSANPGNGGGVNPQPPL